MMTLTPALMTNMVQVFGDFEDVAAATQEYLILGFSPTSASIKRRWRNNGLSADFLADYIATFLPTDRTPREVSEFKSALSYIANELLENAMKYNNETAKIPIDIKLQLTEEAVLFYLTNSVVPEQIVPFQQLLNELLSSDPGEFYMQQLERSSTDEAAHTSGLGLVTMIHDYQAKLAWRFQRVCTVPETVTVTTMVKLALS
jgi:hypothetical protein